MRNRRTAHMRTLGLAVAGLGLMAGAHASAAEFPECLAGLRQAALARGIAAETFDGATNGLQPNDAPNFQSNQPEFSTPPWDYMAGLVDDQRVADGQARYAEQQDALKRIEARYGVPAPVLVAVWGVESDYGRSFGTRPVVQSLATLACYGRKPDFYRNEFIAALEVVQRGDVAPERFNGSWAGAFG
ncbi:MAG: lytic murein transglycosylase, partial [Caulobacteraceae bacterium]|nr:lytic murein transglycosylase [Caulobacter sp.]